MDVISWYVVAVVILAFLLLLLGWWFPWLRTVAYSKVRFVYLRYGYYQLAIPRRYWASVTVLQVIIFIFYIAANILALLLKVKSASEAMTRAGVVAVVNLVPLFFGGRTSFIADWLGISIHSYYLAHHWIGRMVVVESLIHVILAANASQKRCSKLTVSGIIVSILILCGTIPDDDSCSWQYRFLVSLFYLSIVLGDLCLRFSLSLIYCSLL